MAIKINVEKAEDGSYYGTTTNIPGVVAAHGATLSELKSEITEAILLYIETAKEVDKDIEAALLKGIDLEIKIKLPQVFKNVKELNQSQFAKRIGINPGLLRQYATNKNIYVSEKRAQEIQRGLHELGEELLAIKL